MELGRDPNEGSTDPMVEEHWRLGEDLQDRIRLAGYVSDDVEGIAVDIHDLLQACDRLRDELVPEALSADPQQLPEKLRTLIIEIGHIGWHVKSADECLRKALLALSPVNEQPL